MKNVILEHWRLWSSRNQPAVWLPSGKVARTFAQIETESDEVTKLLMDLPLGGVVSLQAPNVPSWPALLLGIWKMGGCAVLVDPTLPEIARNAVEQCCGALWRLDVIDQGFRGTRLNHTAVDFGRGKVDLIKLTSGTSSAPRAILFSAEQLAVDGDQICNSMGISNRDLNYGVVAFSYSYGFSNLIVPLLCRGVPLVAASDTLPRALLAGIEATKATILPAVPVIFQALSGVDGEISSLRLCISAGALLRPETAQAFRTRFNRKIHTFYGASECGGITYDSSEDDITVSGFVGQPLVGVKVEPLIGGGVLVRSAAVGLGYFPISDKWLENTFSPADLLEPVAEGWRITGRRTDLINIGGRKINPVEIEEVLRSHSDILDAVVFGVGSDVHTEKLCAYVVGAQNLSETLLRAYCAQRLASWQVPRTIVAVEAIPVNARGKVNRQDLSREFADL